MTRLKGIGEPNARVAYSTAPAPHALQVLACAERPIVSGGHLGDITV